MKFKQTTKSRYWKWKQTAKKSDKFTTDGIAYTQKEFETLIGHIPAEKAEVKPEPINTIEPEEDYADMEQQDDSGDTEES